MCLIIVCHFSGILIISLRYRDRLSTYTLKKCSINILMHSNWIILYRIQCENTGNKPCTSKKIKLMKVACLHQFQKQLKISDLVNSKYSTSRSK